LLTSASCQSSVFTQLVYVIPRLYATTVAVMK
jgi:hypothetical protein